AKSHGQRPGTSLPYRRHETAFDCVHFASIRYTVPRPSLLAIARRRMLDIGSFPTRTCGTIGRRSFLRLAATVPLGLGLTSAAAQAAERRAARVKSVIFVF